MHFLKCLATIALSGAGLVLAKVAQSKPSKNAVDGGPKSGPKILICSDSTASDYSSKDKLGGWGTPFKELVNVDVLNLARGGRSTRSYIREGLWDELLKQIVKGSPVCVEHGHNDLLNVSLSDRAVLPGIGTETRVVKLPKGGGTETVLTFGAYLRRMIADVKERGGIPIISGMVPRNTFDANGKMKTDYPATEWAREVAKAANVEFIDHTAYSIAAFNKLGPEKTGKLFPLDNTHTDAKGAKLNAETFVLAASCNPQSALKKFIIGTPPGNCLTASEIAHTTGSTTENHGGHLNGHESGHKGGHH